MAKAKKDQEEAEKAAKRDAFRKKKEAALKELEAEELELFGGAASALREA